MRRARDRVRLTVRGDDPGGTGTETGVMAPASASSRADPGDAYEEAGGPYPIGAQKVSDTGPPAACVKSRATSVPPSSPASGSCPHQRARVVTPAPGGAASIAPASETPASVAELDEPLPHALAPAAAAATRRARTVAQATRRCCVRARPAT